MTRPVPSYGRSDAGHNVCSLSFWSKYQFVFPFLYMGRLSVVAKQTIREAAITCHRNGYCLNVMKSVSTLHGQSHYTPPESILHVGICATKHHQLPSNTVFSTPTRLYSNSEFNVNKICIILRCLFSDFKILHWCCSCGRCSHSFNVGVVNIKGW